MEGVRWGQVRERQDRNLSSPTLARVSPVRRFRRDQCPVIPQEGDSSLPEGRGDRSDVTDVLDSTKSTEL